jgi:hypothetical protein
MMTKERELLKEIMCYIASGVISITNIDLGNAAETVNEIRQLLLQHEQEVKKQQLIEKYNIFLRELIENNGEQLTLLKAHDIEAYNRLKDAFS